MPQLLPNLLPKLPLQVDVTWELTLKPWATVTSASHVPWASVSETTLSGYKASPPTQVLVTSRLLPATTQPGNVRPRGAHSAASSWASAPSLEPYAHSSREMLRVHNTTGNMTPVLTSLGFPTVFGLHHGQYDSMYASTYHIYPS